MHTHCPNCACGEARRSACRWFELPLLLLLIGPYRCRFCGTRFLRFFGLAWGRGA
jgi:hypothetical protein